MPLSRGPFGPPIPRPNGPLDRGMGGSMDRGIGGSMDRSLNDSGMGGMSGSLGMGGGMNPGPSGSGMGGGGGFNSPSNGGWSGGQQGGGGGGLQARSDKIVVKGLPENCTWHTLKDRFSHAGDIKFAEMKDRGTGVIRFGSERDAERAVAMMNNQRIDG